MLTHPMKTLLFPGRRWSSAERRLAYFDEGKKADTPIPSNEGADLLKSNVKDAQIKPVNNNTQTPSERRQGKKAALTYKTKELLAALIDDYLEGTDLKDDFLTKNSDPFATNKRFFERSLGQLENSNRNDVALIAAAIAGLTGLFLFLHQLEKKQRDARINVDNSKAERNRAEVKKLEAEADETKAKAEKIRVETEKLKNSSKPEEKDTVKPIPEAVYPKESVTLYQKKLHESALFYVQKKRSTATMEEVQKGLIVETEEKTGNLVFRIDAKLKAELAGTEFTKMGPEQGFELHPKPGSTQEEWKVVISKENAVAKQRFQQMIDALNRLEQKKGKADA